ncbi:plant intracellular Ras-group-related LRR protein 3 [Trifolium pratense]|uniref:plant intracellular Ras-group-related LRR protein 3 n=1 Tax=Trifolium pratense TaxID=57577 RepID=UPI001E6951DC|nr:plant intracellular Ras-group-related LRR protein 3 [Trifolium pratense]
MDFNPNLNDFPILSFLLNHLHPQTYPPLTNQLYQNLLTHFPHFNNPELLPSLTNLISNLNITHTLSFLRTLGPRPDPSSISASRAKIAEPDVDVAVYQALLKVEDMHEECVKLLMVAEERLVEGYRLFVEELVKGVGGEDVNEGVVGILRKVEEGEVVEQVDLSDMKLRVFPEVFGKMKGLVLLNLSHNQLKVIPDSIEGLQKLVELDVSSNLLESLPDCIGLLTNLKILNLSGNKLTALPESVSLCRSLVELDASFNNLMCLPTNTAYGLVNLEKLSIHLNKIRFLPLSIGEMKSLRYLDVHFNELHGLPQSIGKLTNLEYLNIGSNFNDMTQLPETIGGLVNLKELDLSNNQIRALPYAFCKLEKLTKLNLDQNPIIVPPVEVVNQGVEAMKEFMAKRWLEFIDEERKKNMAETQNQQAETGWLAWGASLLNNVAGTSESVAEYFGVAKAPKDTLLYQQL